MRKNILMLILALTSAMCFCLAACGEGDSIGYAPHDHNYVDGRCSVCSKLSPGLYDADDNLIVTYEDSGIKADVDYKSNSTPEKGTVSYAVAKKYKNTAKVVLPDNLTRIGQCAFEDIKSVIDVEVPSSVAEIASYAFNNMSGLKVKFEVGSKLETIGNSAFADSGIEEIKIPASVKIISKFAFCYCRKLQVLTFERGSKLTEIGQYAFTGCYSLASVEIPASVKNIGEVAFQECTALENVSFEEGINLENMGNGVFSECNSLETVKLPAGLKSVPKSAFAGCEKLISVNIPSSVTSIGAWAFNMCERLNNVVFDGNSKITNIEENAFLRTTNFYRVFFGGSEQQLKNISVGDKNDNFKNALVYYYKPFVIFNDGASWHYVNDRATIWGQENIDTNKYPGLYDVADYLIVSYADSGLVIDKDYVSDHIVSYEEENYPNAIIYNKYPYTAKIVLPENLSKIGSGALSQCHRLEEVIIQSGTTELCVGAFFWCENLKKVTINSDLKIIGTQAFALCSSLETINIPDTVESVGARAFSECEKIESLNLMNVKELDMTVFLNCNNLKSIIVGDSLQALNGDFISGKITIYYYGSKSFWLTDVSYSEKLKLDKLEVYYYSEERPTVSGKYWYYENGEIVRYELSFG